MNEKVVSDELFALMVEKLKSKGNVSLTVTGSSMYPYFHDRKDTVELCPVSLPFKKNSVVFYRRSDGVFVLHRIVKTGDKCVWCRGDNQFSRPEAVNAESIFGVVSSYTINGKKYTDRSFRSRAVLFYVKFFYYFRKLSKKIKKTVRKKTRFLTPISMPFIRSS